jgi:hypothetical protein
MPRLSARAIALRALTAATRRVRQIFLIVNFFRLISEHNESFLAFIEFKNRLDELRKTRYYLSRPIRKYDKHIFERDLDGKSDIPWLNEEEFLNKYHTCCAGVDHLTELLKNAPVFKPGKRGRKMLPVKHQIMIWLHFFGHEGMTLKQ